MDCLTAARPRGRDNDKTQFQRQARLSQRRTELLGRRSVREIPLFILEAALLIECGYRSDVDEMWYVYCDEAVRRERLKASRGYSDEKITSIMASQLTDQQFREGSDEVIDNSGAPEKTHRRWTSRSAGSGNGEQQIEI